MSFTLLFAFVSACFPASAEPGEDASNIQTNPGASSLMRTAVPMAMDLMRNACAASVEARGIQPLRFDELDADIQEPYRRVFPKSVLDAVTLYFDVPFHDGTIGVGLLSMIGMAPLGGGSVLAMAFDDEVYLYCSQEALEEGPAMTTVLAHELCHVAQYQALGYEGYKTLYAEELGNGIPYHELKIERDAYTLGRLFPDLVPPGFFAFLPPTQADEDDPQNGNIKQVVITASYEALERRAPLAFRPTEDKPGAYPRIDNPFGEEPLHVFKRVSAEGAELLHNAPISLPGSWLVAVGDQTGAEVAWRQLDGFRSQWIPGKLRFADINDDGILDIEQEGGEGRATWWWTGGGFARMGAGP